ncbi:MAG TPA: 1-deoxy-D-xylulose-5-phosphate reductoisomerase [Acidimicrobiia bacterium]
MSLRHLVVLGATGSIGERALEVAGELSLPVAGVAARTPGEGLARVAERHPDARVIATGGSSAERAGFLERVPRAEFGHEALSDVAATPGATVVNAVVGAAGLPATMSAIAAGNRLALANKESLVAGGRLVMAALETSGAELIPVDSEHSALFQLLERTPAPEVERLILTASGGPFRGMTADSLEEVTPAEALAHPTWDMGRRISVDSATLANKGLEVIEAHVLFGLPLERIGVVVHPQSVVHSLIQLTDGALLAHLGAPDMRVPIRYALTHPERTPGATVPFSLTEQALTFEPPDLDSFPALRLAYEAGRAGGSAPAAYNAADEVAVAAFLQGRIGFRSISRIIERTMDAAEWRVPGSVEDVFDVDREARSVAASMIGSC